MYSSQSKSRTGTRDSVPDDGTVRSQRSVSTTHSRQSVVSTLAPPSVVSTTMRRIAGDSQSVKSSATSRAPIRFQSSSRPDDNLTSRSISAPRPQSFRSTNASVDGAGSGSTAFSLTRKVSTPSRAVALQAARTANEILQKRAEGSRFGHSSHMEKGYSSASLPSAVPFRRWTIGLRVRPIVPHADAPFAQTPRGSPEICVHVGGDGEVLKVVSELGAATTFRSDATFDNTARTSDIYGRLVRSLVKTSLDQRTETMCVLYGTSDSGKLSTMVGSAGENAQAVAGGKTSASGGIEGHLGIRAGGPFSASISTGSGYDRSHQGVGGLSRGGLVQYALVDIFAATRAHAASDLVAQVHLSAVMIHEERMYDLLFDLADADPDLFEESMGGQMSSANRAPHVTWCPSEMMQRSAEVLLSSVTSPEIAGTVLLRDPETANSLILPKLLRRRAYFQRYLGFDESRCHLLLRIAADFETEQTLGPNGRTGGVQSAFGGSGFTSGAVEKRLVAERSVFSILQIGGCERFVPQRRHQKMIRREVRPLDSSISAFHDWVFACARSTESGENIPSYPDDTQLMRLLRPSFEGTCRTTLIATINPCLYACDDTLSCLRTMNRLQLVRTIGLPAATDSLNKNIEAGDEPQQRAVPDFHSVAEDLLSNADSGLIYSLQNQPLQSLRYSSLVHKDTTSTLPSTALGKKTIPYSDAVTQAIRTSENQYLIPLSLNPSHTTDAQKEVVIDEVTPPPKEKSRFLYGLPPPPPVRKSSFPIDTSVTSSRYILPESALSRQVTPSENFTEDEENQEQEKFGMNDFLRAISLVDRLCGVNEETEMIQQVQPYGYHTAADPCEPSTQFEDDPAAVTECFNNNLIADPRLYPTQQTEAQTSNTTNVDHQTNRQIYYDFNTPIEPDDFEEQQYHVQNRPQQISEETLGSFDIHVVQETTTAPTNPTNEVIALPYKEQSTGISMDESPATTSSRLVSLIDAAVAADKTIPKLVINVEAETQVEPELLWDSSGGSSDHLQRQIFLELARLSPHEVLQMILEMRKQSAAAMEENRKLREFLNARQL